MFHITTTAVAAVVPTIQTDRARGCTCSSKLVKSMLDIPKELYCPPPVTLGLDQDLSWH